jgi:hypothetical protein
MHVAIEVELVLGLRKLGIASTGMFHFEGLNAEEARKLMTGYPNIDGNGTHNFSPTAEELVEITEQYDGTLSGYVIPVGTGRTDARIVLNGFTISCSIRQMKELKKRLEKADHAPDGVLLLKRDEGVKTPRYRFWWD